MATTPAVAMPQLFLDTYDSERSGSNGETTIALTLAHSNGALFSQVA